MKNKLLEILVMAARALTASAQATAKAHSKSIVVESPSDLSEVAQRSSEAIYLYESDGRHAFLYLEQGKRA